MTELQLQLEQAKHNLEEAQVYINKMRNKLELLEVDKFKDLKKAFSEGAIIEAKQSYSEWHEECNPKWYFDAEYRITDNISISSWNAHKDIIKQYWNGAEIEMKLNSNSWSKRAITPTWNITSEYRIKQKWKLPEYEDGAEWTIDSASKVQKWSSLKITKAGKRRATEELAERTAEMSKQRDLLEAYRDHLDPTWKDSLSTNAWYLLFHSGEYKTAYRGEDRTIGAVYMGRQTAKEICQALNNGSISL